MTRFQQITNESIPSESKPMVQATEADYGFIPNVVQGLARSPEALKSYRALSEAFESSSLSPEEQQIVLLTTSRLNECEYCTSVHSMLAEKTDLDWPTIERIRNREPLASERFESLRTFTERVVSHTGDVPRDVWTEFLSMGFTVQQALDVVVGVTLKTLTNTVNHMIQTPLDDQFETRKWSADQAAKASA